MATSTATLVTSYITSSCTNNKEEHKALIDKLIYMCEHDRECIKYNMDRMKDLCKLIRENHIVKFYQHFKKHRDTYGFTDNIMLQWIAEKTFLPMSTVRDMHKRGKNANELLKKIRAKEDSWQAWIRIENRSDFATLRNLPDTTDTDLLLTFGFDADDERWKLRLQVITNDDMEALTYSSDEIIPFRRTNGVLTRVAKRTIRQIFQNEFVMEFEFGNESDASTPIRVGDVEYEFTEVFFSE